MTKSHREQEHICPICGKHFLPTSGVQKYCATGDCAYKAWYARRVKFKDPKAIHYCELCGAKIIRRNATRFCSDAHMYEMKKRRQAYPCGRKLSYIPARGKVDIFAKLRKKNLKEVKKDNGKRQLKVVRSGIHYTSPEEKQRLREEEARLRKSRRYYK